MRFDGCFPGWYPGRALHVHILVRPPGNVGETDASNASVVSQVFFDEALTREIFASVDGYALRGQPDTSLDDDGVLSGVDDRASYVVGHARMSDGALLA